MSLLEALLLDPVRINVWVAKRNDSVTGTGTQTDPYNWGLIANFDTLMSGLAVNTCVHLGPGEFQTAGYYDGLAGSGWQPKSGQRIVGSGIDVTTLKLVNDTAATTERVYAVAHQLSASTVDHFELSDLTVDCNLGGVSGSASTAGAVRILGNHSRVVRVKVKNWGNKAEGTPGFVIAMLTGDPDHGVNGVVNCGIEECIAVSPEESCAIESETARRRSDYHRDDDGPVYRGGGRRHREQCAGGEYGREPSRRKPLPEAVRWEPVAASEEGLSHCRRRCPGSPA